MPSFLKKNQEVQLFVSDLAYGAKGVSRLENFVVFIPYTLPGEKVLAKISKIKKSYAEATLLEVLEPSAFRTEPICLHFGICGGCLLQNLSYAKQLEVKSSFVKDCLSHIGRFENPPVKEALGSEEIFAYRNKMEYSFSADSSGNITLGLHQKDEYDKIVDLAECHLADDIFYQILDFIRNFFQELKTPVYDTKNHSGYLRYLIIRCGKKTGEISVNLVTNRGEIPAQDRLVRELTSKFPQITSLIHGINSKKATIAVSEEYKVLFGKEYILEKLKNFSFKISPFSFFQTNSLQAERLYEKVVESGGLSGDERVLDIYSGTGTIAIFLSQYCQEVVGIESNSEAVSDAQKNVELNQIKNCNFLSGEAKEILKKLTSSEKYFEVVVLDPPRAGVHPQVIKNLLKLSPQKIIYVSCNPSTLARDLKLLCEKEYNLKEVIPVDMFPHTFHIEAVAKLEKSRL